MKINEEKLKQIKEESKQEHVPIIMDDTLEYIEKYIAENKIEVKKVLEIGTATGYSAINFVKLMENGTVTTIERDEKRYNKAKQNIKDMNLEKNIILHYGDALEILPKISGQYDLIFIDAAKSKYPIFLDYCLEHLSPLGVIFADNVLFKGYVMSNYDNHKQRTAVRHLREFIAKIENDEKLETKIIEVGDGLGVIRWKS